MNKTSPKDFGAPPAKRARKSGKKIRELAFLLPFVGVVLLYTPIMNAVTADNQEPHLLQLIFYIFGIWAALIFSALVLSKFLIKEMDGE